MLDNTPHPLLAQYLTARITAIPSLQAYPHSGALLPILAGETAVSSAGFPYLSDASFRCFIEQVPHLFQEGLALLTWVGTLAESVAGDTSLSEEEHASLARAVRVLRTMVFTAGVTAPPDLWLLRQVLSVHKALGVLDRLVQGEALDPDSFAKSRGLHPRQLRIDLHFLYARGYLRKQGVLFRATDEPGLVRVLQGIRVLDPAYRTNLVPRLTACWTGERMPQQERTFLQTWLRFETSSQPTVTWKAGCYQLELGYRLVPVVLSLIVAGIAPSLKEGHSLTALLPEAPPEIASLLEAAGLVQDDRVTLLGARVFERGPGPFGIVAAYYPYLNRLDELLTSAGAPTWVNRGENVAASQLANRKTFAAANDALDAFCKDYGFRYTVFIEHAVGQGEASRQRYTRSGEDTIRYFGADLEDAAIDQAIAQQEKGELPHNMAFIRAADIGDPQRVIGFLQQRHLANEPTVMMVGNGFHEIRNQTNEKMIRVFRGYQEAGFVLIFTEETALSDADLLHTAWNTYHAGFRYVHETSGQGLRPAAERDDGGDRWSWSTCARRGGYHLLDRYGYRSRTIYPYHKPDRDNPSISRTYFCVPQRIARRLGIL